MYLLHAALLLDFIKNLRLEISPQYTRVFSADENIKHTKSLNEGVGRRQAEDMEVLVNLSLTEKKCKREGEK